MTTNDTEHETDDDNEQFADWSDTVRVCPECNVSALDYIKGAGSFHAGDDAPEYDYQCTNCQAKLDAADTIERPRQNSGIKADTVLDRHFEMDPDQIRMKVNERLAKRRDRKAGGS